MSHNFESLDLDDQPVVMRDEEHPSQDVDSSRKAADEDEKAANANVPSDAGAVEDDAGSQIPVPHPRSMTKSIGLVMTCTFAMMVNVGTGCIGSIHTYHIFVADFKQHEHFDRVPYHRK